MASGSDIRVLRKLKQVDRELDRSALKNLRVSIDNMPLRELEAQLPSSAGSTWWRGQTYIRLRQALRGRLRG